ncbi:tRNA m5U54 methyltransferase [Campylobacter gracilis]|uniref:Putative tRNA (Uracil-5-)-methyltransferase n=1 Tax=Campylobacter gracilis RM3268 TaxID=553220 RepID=C8PJJ3_9BACT|nr:tRNA m5U54 methyltransferase [Campylobacter gracilis]EEV17098.1 putative tRNA (uracil-5-)-methyltransferase [Campylobacter gracilis RM3268]SUW81785.1 tRNA (uracil-5-)-methyltransferase [Campylobacter gracilis]
MNCESFGSCGSCTLGEPYEDQILYKKQLIGDKFREFFDGEFEFFASQPQNYRIRAEFGIWHDIWHSAFDLAYTMGGARSKKILINECPKVALPIANLMPRLLEVLRRSEALKEKLFGVEFISCASGILATLLYHKRLGEREQEAICELAGKLGIRVMARARGQKLLSGELSLTDELCVDERVYKFRFGENAFIQPNRGVNEKMIAWARSCVDFGKEGMGVVCAAQNFAVKNSIAENSVAQNSSHEQSDAQNSTDRNSASENSAEFDAACRNFVKANSACIEFNGENFVKFNYASADESSADKNSARKDLDVRNSASQNLDCEKRCVQNSACEKLIAQNSSCEQSAPQNSSCEKHSVRPENSAARDLLELYCGHGNFTIPLAAKFNRVLASEISKSSIANARINCELNGVCNAQFVRLSADELMSAFARRREFERLKGIDIFGYDFSHVLIDPPRAGLEPSVIDFIKNFENLIYISCNPQTLFENLRSLCATHEVRRFAIFDQFAHTAHIECGVLLKRRS